MSIAKKLSFVKLKKPTLTDVLRGIAIAVLVLVVGVMVLSSIPTLFGHRHYIIVTASMSPTINVGDVVIIKEQTDLDLLEVDQIIAFMQDLNNDGTAEVVVHYLAQINTTDPETRTYRTIRENTTVVDPWTVNEEDIVGTYVTRIPLIGKFLLFAQSTFGKIIIVIDFVVVFSILILLKDSEKKKASAGG